MIQQRICCQREWRDDQR